MRRVALLSSGATLVTIGMAHPKLPIGMHAGALIRYGGGDTNSRRGDAITRIYAAMVVVEEVVVAVLEEVLVVAVAVVQWLEEEEEVVVLLLQTQLCKRRGDQLLPKD